VEGRASLKVIGQACLLRTHRECFSANTHTNCVAKGKVMDQMEASCCGD